MFEIMLSFKKKRRVPGCIAVNVVLRLLLKMGLSLEFNVINVRNVDSSLRGKLLMENQ